MPRIQCAKCREKFEIDESLKGGTTSCPACGFLLRLPALLLEPGTELDGYRIESMLAVGGMGEVYKATQLSMDRPVALKLLSPSVTTDKEALDDFLREVRMLARMSHPNIVDALAAGEVDGIHYLAMSYVDGETLQTLLNDGPMREGEALEIARTVAETLQYAWQKHRLLHRDVKPANVMVDRDGRIALMDLGIARIVEDGASGHNAFVHGTPQYMSPEQASGREDLDARADVYSLGATLYELLTGRELFPDDDNDRVLLRQINDLPASPRRINPNVSPGCEALIMRWLAKDRDNRPADWDAAIAELDALLQSPGAPGQVKKKPASNGRPARSASKPAARRKTIPTKKAPLPKRSPKRPLQPYEPRPDDANGLIITMVIVVLFVIVIVVAANK